MAHLELIPGNKRVSTQTLDVKPNPPITIGVYDTSRACGCWLQPWASTKRLDRRAGEEFQKGVLPAYVILLCQNICHYSLSRCLQ